MAQKLVTKKELKSIYGIPTAPRTLRGSKSPANSPSG
jgi:hypothetical protein